MSYKNPVIPGFYPDPSVCRVEEDYYLVTSSFEYFPGVPVFHSRDLVNWRQIGHCLTRESQLPLEKAEASAGIYAPTIRHHRGRFYMVTTNSSLKKHLIVSTDDPFGEWSEPLWLEHGYIDPSLFFDDDGKLYFTSNGPGGIVQSELDLVTGRFVGDMRVLWAGTGGQAAEAPHIYKIRDLYYLMIAEGGTEYAHMETIARSKSPWGPFEPCPHNPILTNRGRQRSLQCTGHADLVEDHQGNWWMVFLAVRPVGYPPAHHLGRETCLAPVTWDADGWPVVNGDGTVDLNVPSATLPPKQWPVAPVRDDFETPKLGMEWNFLRNPRQEDWSLSARPGCLRLNGSPVTLDAEDSLAWVGQRQRHHTCSIRTLLEFAPRKDNEEAGLVVYMNPRHHYEIAVKGTRVIVRRRIGSLIAEVASLIAPQGKLTLGIMAEPMRYRFMLGEQCLAEAEPRYLATEIAGGFTGLYFAMYATGNGQRCSTPADFDSFEYSTSNG
jgi:alpha-N-arabinofuranosidase